MKITIARTYSAKNTTGIITDESARQLCVCVEPPRFVDTGRMCEENVADRTCVPEGLYHVRKHVSAKFGQCFAFDDKETAPRTSILIHAGNYAADSKIMRSDSHGCIIAGRAFGDINNDGVADVIDSKATMAELYKRLPAKFEVKIVSKK